jgi:hypothetical protein
MSDSPPITEKATPDLANEAETPNKAETPVIQPAEPKPSYVKLAMRNMVRKRGKSLFHFALTTVALLVALVGLSYLTR